jgi:small subunit ribosomal protein S6
LQAFGGSSIIKGLVNLPFCLRRANPGRRPYLAGKFLKQERSPSKNAHRKEVNRLAEEENPVAETTEATEETDATQASEETSDNTSDTSADEATADEATADEATADEASGEGTVDANSDVASETQPELNESLTATASASDQAPAQVERVEVENGREYELMFIVRITESTDAATERVRAIIEQSSGAVDNVRVSEQRRLAYPIQKEIEGFYIVLNGRFTKEAAAELDRALKLDEAVLRHMMIRLDEE